MAEIDSLQILQRLRSGDNVAFREVFDKYAGKCIEAFLRYLHSEDTCIQMTIELFSSLRADAGKIEDIESFIEKKACEVNLIYLKRQAEKELAEADVKD